MNLHTTLSILWLPHYFFSLTMATVNTLFGLSVILPVNVYHWQELPQVSFLSWQTRVTKHIFCCNKSVLFVKKNCGDKIMFVVTKLLLRQIFVPTNMCLLRQKYICHNKTFVTTSILSSQQKTWFVFVATKILSRQKWYLWQRPAMIKAYL